MEPIEWTEEFSVGVEKIDSQHKKLIGFINKLIKTVGLKEEKPVLGEVLTDLIEYTMYHFETEERAMAQYSYPEYTVHKVAHGKLTEQVSILCKKFNKENIAIENDVLEFLKIWLTDHILKMDKKVGAFLKNKNVFIESDVTY